MIGFLEKRRMRKELKEYLNAARHARNMREDIAAPEDLKTLAQAEKAVHSFRKSGGPNNEIKAAVKVLQDATEKIYPSSNRSGMRENVEVLIVAIGAAMAIRAFFFQPYKIPTGSMQPTLNGILVEAQAGPTVMDRLPFKFFQWLATGTSYKEVRAKTSGDLIPFHDPMGNPYMNPETGEPVYAISLTRTKAVINIGGVQQKIPIYMADMVNETVNETGVTHVEKGDVIAQGEVIAGDHILVNKMKYNFVQPERGDIAVFDTRNIDHPNVPKGEFYIKRMVGIPGEKIQIKDDRYLVAEGEVIEEPPVFKMINESPLYEGHTFAGELRNNDAYIQLGDDEYLMMGDNTLNSLDGRYFGAVPRGDFQGSAFFVYWPFREHWGTVE